MSKIAERLRILIEQCTKETRRFKDLEERSTVSAEAWRSFWNAKQRPSAEMIEAAAQNWPQFAFWLATGISDEPFGHRAPHYFELPSLTRQVTAAGDLFLYRIALDQAIQRGERTGVTRDDEDAMEDLSALRWNQIQRKQRIDTGEDGN